MKISVAIQCILLIVFLCLLNFLEGGNRAKKSLVFAPTSLYGLFLAIAVPVDIPDLNVFVSYNFEANYHLPINSSEMGDMVLLAPVSETTVSSRSFTRRLAYGLLEDKFNKSGYPGRECLLRSICEAAEMPLNHNGVLGGIMHVIFTPSSSKNESLPSSYYLAEKRGLSGDCDDYIAECPTSLLDSISKVVHIPYHEESHNI